MAFFDPLIIAYPQVQEGEAQPGEVPEVPAVPTGAFPLRKKQPPKPKPWLSIVKRYLELKLA